MKKKQILALALLSAIGLTSVAQADDHNTDDRWYVAPFGTFIKSGGDRGAKDDWGGGMGFGKMLNEYFNVELKGFYQGFNSETGGRWDLTGGTADLQYYFFRDKFSPYAVIGAGGMNTSFRGESGATIIGEAGAGFTYELHDNFLLRSDVRYRYNNNLNAHLQSGTEEFHDMTVNVGFVVPFGEKPQAVASNYEAPAPIPAVDDCSTRDSDADGVNDCLDKCPGTMAGSKVDYQGCPVQIELKGVNFKYDSAELTPNAKAILDGVASQLKAYPQGKEIEVQGHTSSEGGYKYNVRLSQHRSQSVVDYLRSKGVTDSMHAKGYGPDRPVAENQTEAGRSLNRRVELVWIE
ncbi:MAG: OmpA family protein [Methylicorpusculum sp.]|uniref:OmpA family protein n=1 Tax=Methylicorpusculum sp. TaxID=2713644 RepID=UPI00271AD686|nr:OmpA family protein [Methylicorpusculum sp.]MDO8845623.1 OmpA family protein [Methylicorpusculum sp.]MDO8940819.1 OmpA family protein [Methylicorpusculum sp.]MDO9241065.1 OmpA family protein [Methylicorpusculum sp.]MDP2204418.1 OmpA family protein [Methylicorpusculum sp.]